MTGTRAPRDSGAALLTILLIVAVMSVAALAALDSLGRSLNLSRISSERSQALWAARSTEAVGATAIRRLEDLGLEAMSNPETFREPITLPFDRGVIQASIQDASNCFNLNSITGEPDNVADMQFQELLVALGFFRNNARELSDALADWIDDDTVPRTFGAEDGYYTTLDTPYRPANSQLVNITELRAVRGFTPEVIAQIAPLVCVRAATYQPWLNIDTMTEDQAPLLVALYSDELSTEDARTVIRARPVSGWQSRQAFVDNSVIKAIAEPARRDSLLMTRPSHVRLTALIVSGSSRETLDLVYEVGKGSAPRLVQRSTGAF
ncbi:type II secretion system minor pseudopilin GspK [Hyphomonas johnsonii]|uniref:Type II secretion system protein K n=1 Tax=Hyphomonas johnsonii MHS-2 TaxID=1280950 RepID=A0A059FUV9_9PROT|nr:type II secretion system minor pseudopilin GspK [Hyphomonas johnsonii]KCZ94301.1 general secretion pathway protein K [Hyphomonas johnsonii MHS-2]